MNRTRTLRELIIAALKNAPFQTAAQLLESCRRTSRLSYTKQALYKELRQLRTEHVLISVERKFALNITYLESEQIKLSKARETLLTSSEFLLSQRRTKLKFSSLLEMKGVWSHLVIALLRQTQSRELFSWNPHPWFYLVQPAHEEQLLEGLDELRVHMYKIVGGDTYLDRLTLNQLRKRGHSVSSAHSPFHSQRSAYFSVIGDWVIQVTLDKKAVGEIGLLYQRAKSAAQVSFSEAIKLFAGRNPAKLEVSLNPVLSRNYRHKFLNYFGFDVSPIRTLHKG